MHNLLTLILIFFLVNLLGCASQVQKNQTVIETASKTSPTKTKTRIAFPELFLQAKQNYLDGNYPKTIHMLDTYRVLNREVQDPWSNYLLYYSFIKVGNYDRALGLASALVKSNPYHSLGYHQVGLAQLWKGKTKLAIENFKRALNFEHQLPRLHFHLGLAYQAENEQQKSLAAYNLAEKEYIKVLREEPNDFLANYELSSLYLYTGKNLAQVEKLLIKCEEIVDDSPVDLSQSPELYSQFYIPVKKGILEYAQGKARSSIRTLVKAMKHSPTGAKLNQAEIYYYLGQDYRLLGNFTESYKFLNLSLELDPKGMYALKAQRSLQTMPQRNKLVN